MGTNKLVQLLVLLQLEIQSEQFKERFRTSAKYFTRNRILTLPNFVMMRLNIFNRTTNVEICKLRRFLSTFLVKHVPSNQAFSKAASHVKWEGFKYLNDFFVHSFYRDTDYKKYAGKYILAATDGSAIDLPNDSPELKAHFGEYTNGQASAKCMAQCVKIYDPLNRLTISSVLSPYNAKDTKGHSEKALFDELVPDLANLIDLPNTDVILIGDKYYPCFYYFYSLPQQNMNFVFLCHEKFCLEVEEFVKSGQTDAVLNIDMTKSQRKYGRSVRRSAKGVEQLPIPDMINVRCVRVETGKAAPLLLLTNISSQDLSSQQIGEVYDHRWTEEVSFDFDKNVLELENFASKSVNGVLQEFHGKLLTGNVTELVISDAQHEIDKDQATKNNKNTYIVDRTIACGLIKDEIVFLLDATEPADLWFTRMSKTLSRYKITVKKGRSFPRKFNKEHRRSTKLRRGT